MPLNTGQIVNERYRIARLLGQGGMGAVYRAWDLTLNIPVALKELLPDPSLSPYELAELREQFRQEARILAGLTHPNLPRVTDFFEWSGNVYLIMDFVEGESLAALIERHGRLSEEQVVRWATQLLDAIAACHARNILHRDIKPQNIIIRSDGQAVLVDFGLVKLWDPKKPQTQRIIRGMGTREYASPEQFGMRGAHTEPRSDIYSLGATLYHALVGREPPSALERMAGHNRLVPPREMGVQVQPRVQATIMQALALSPEERFPTVSGMTTALCPPAEMPYSSVREQPHPAPTPSPTPLPTARVPEQPRTPPVRSSRWPLELGTAMAVAPVGTLILHGILFGDRSPADQYIGLAIGSLVLGALGWFIGDTIFQALTMPDLPTTDRTERMPGNRPTQRLVMSTRKLMRNLSAGQQAGLLALLVVIAAAGAWFLGPVIADIPFLWDYLPSYAIAAPLVYAATGRRSLLAGLAHLLVAVVGGVLLKASVGTTTEFVDLLLASVVSAAAIAGLAFLSAKTVLRR
ncbi:MAG: serine/threonine-protein kinase [Anaerolineae bacterium]